MLTGRSTRKLEIILVSIITLLGVFFSSPKFITQLIRKPPGTVYVGMTTYFEDFYYYLDQFYQGKEGNWVTENRFSIERFPPTLVYFDNLVFGKIGGIFGFESFQSYNYFGILFKGLFIIVSYVLIALFFPTSLVRRIATYLIFLFSTGLPNIVLKNGSLILNPALDIFRSASRPLARFGTSATGMLVNFLFIVLLLALLTVWKREQRTAGSQHSKTHVFLTPIQWMEVIGISLAFVFMIFGDVVISAVLVWACLVLLLINRIQTSSFPRMPAYITVLSILAVLLCGLGGYVTFTISRDPVYSYANAWDIIQNMQAVKTFGLGNTLMGFGLQLPFFICGLYILLKKKNKSLYELTGIIIVTTCWVAYLWILLFNIQFPGFRFLFPALYLFMSVMVMIAIDTIALKFRSAHLFPLLIGAYLCINFIAFFPGWYHAIQPVQEPDYHFTYIPDELYTGLVFLRTAEPKSGNVLASPYTSIDLMIPGIAGRYTYSGHSLTTYNSAEKDDLANKFFNSWTDTPTTHEFLEENNIRFIVVTKYSARLSDIKTYYPFLHVVFENPTVTIFRYDPA